MVSSRTSLRRLAAALLPLLAALTCGALLAACAEDESEGDDVEALLDRAFRHPIERADLSIDAYLRVDGLEGFERPIRLQAAGPYIGGGNGAPQLDLDLNLGAQGAGQTVQFGLLRTADRAFVKFGGEFYEQPRRQVRRANRELGAARGRRGSSLRDLGLAPRTWVTAARDEGEEKVAGVSTRHVSGSLDTRRVLGDLNRLVRRSASAIGGSAGVPGALSGEQLDDLAEMVRNPSFDVYVGKQDEVIRRLSAQLEVRVPEESRTSAAGIEAGALRFSIEFRDVGGDQLIQAPARARPIADLTRQLRGLSALGGLGALEGAPGGDRGDRAAERPRGGPADADPGSSPEGEDGVEAFRRYADCLDRARPEDTEALSRCRELLR